MPVSAFSACDCCQPVAIRCESSPRKYRGILQLCAVREGGVGAQPHVHTHPRPAWLGAADSNFIGRTGVPVAGGGASDGQPLDLTGMRPMQHDLDHVESGQVDAPIKGVRGEAKLWAGPASEVRSESRFWAFAAYGR